jgi:predicted nuclease of predicted toxin-antitoxin system
MLFLIDENLPTRVGDIFTRRGFNVEHVASLPELQGRPDEAIFNYAVRNSAVIVTRDIGFVSLARFSLHQLEGILLKG